MTRHRVVEAITARFLDPSFADFDLDTVDASALDANRLLGAWRTLPLGSPRRVVIARNLEDAQAGEIGKLAEGIKQGSQKGCLILDSASETGREMNALVKAADAAGVVVNCQSPKPDDARVFLTETATAKGVKYEAAAAAELVRRIGPDLWMLSTETEKLANHVWPETVIRKADVERLSPASPEDRIFAMIDAVCEGRQGAADSMLRDVFLAGDDIRGTAHRTLALRNAVAGNPHVAMTALLHRLVLDTFGERSLPGCVEASVRKVYLSVQEADLKDSPSAKAVTEREQAWKGDIPFGDDAALWTWLDTLDDAAAVAASSVHRFVRRHPRGLAAAVVVLLTGFGATAFGIAPIAPDAAKLTRTVVSESVPLVWIGTQLEQHHDGGCLAVVGREHEHRIAVAVRAVDRQTVMDELAELIGLSLTSEIQRERHNLRRFLRRKCHGDSVPRPSGSACLRCRHRNVCLR